MDIVAKFYEGRAARAKAHAEKERKAQLTLRGGSAGCVLRPGECQGNPQKALARFLGYQMPVSDDSEFFFDMGFANEDVWAANLQAAGLKIWTDKEHRISSEISGFKFTGSPDIRILDEQGVPSTGLELKSICGSSMAMGALVKGEPKSDHVIQASTYSKMLDLPYKLVYTSYTNQSPFAGEAKKYGIWKVPPGIKSFDIKRSASGQIVVDNHTTPFNVEGVFEYYRTIVRMWQEKDASLLRPRDLDIYGEPKEYGKKGELAYDDFYQAVGVPSTWGEFVRRVKAECEFVGETHYI